MIPAPEDAPPTVRTDSAAIVSLVLGVVSLPGLLFPPCLGAAVIGVVLGWIARRRIAAAHGALKGGRIAIAGIALSVLGGLLSLVLPAFVVGVWIYAIFHGGQLPSGA